LDSVAESSSLRTVGLPNQKGSAAETLDPLKRRPLRHRETLARSNRSHAKKCVADEYRSAQSSIAVRHSLSSFDKAVVDMASIRYQLLATHPVQLDRTFRSSALAMSMVSSVVHTFEAIVLWVAAASPRWLEIVDIRTA
jgi:hypothetical protein